METIRVKGRSLEEMAETEVTEETFAELTGGKGDDDE